MSVTGFCPADCADVELAQNPDNNCDIQPRKRNIDRFMFFTCDTDLPSPFTCGALTTLVNNNKVVFTSPLANVEVQDPTYQELQLADCIPIAEVASGRVVNFQDRIAIDTPSGIASPGALPIPFYNYDFWQDKVSKQESLRYAAVYCDGSVEVAKDENGNYLSATVRAFKKQEKVGSGNDVYYIEYIVGQMSFRGGDPWNLSVKPELTPDNVVFDISACGFY